VGIQRTIEIMAPFVQINPGALEIFKPDEVARLAADIQGVPSSVLNSPEELEEIRAAAAQAQQAQQQAAQIPEGAAALKDVAAAAGVSVGAVYGRFPSKEAILLLLGIIVIDGVCRRFEEALEPPRGTTGTFGALARAYVTTLVREFTRHRSLIREVRKHAGGDPSLRRLADRTNRTTHGAFLERARTFAGQIDHPDPESRLNYALFAVNAAGREAILSGALSTYAVDGSNAELIEELTRMMTAYVGIED